MRRDKFLLESTLDNRTADAAARRPSSWSRFKKRFSLIFFLTVLVPTGLASIYYGFIASDVYISESHFVVRSSQRQPQVGGIGALLQSTGFSRSLDDTYSVHDYVLSRDALRLLMSQMDVAKALQSDAIDIVNRFPGPMQDVSFEAFYRHYKRHVTIEFDTVSSISTLYVRGYSAREAQKIDDLLLTMGERLINTLNDRSRSDLVGAAKREVAEAEQRARTAALALSGFRSNQSLYDPDRQSLIQLQGVAKLQDELLALQAQLAQLVQLSPSNPQVASLRGRIDQMKQTIARESSRVAGGDSSLTSKSTGYDRLLLEKTFSDRQLASAFASLETARDDAQRQQLYLERLVQPNEPDKALEPRRIRTVSMVFVLGLILWGVVSLIVSSIKEHSD